MPETSVEVVLSGYLDIYDGFMCNIAAFVIVLAYPVSRRVHKDILAAIDQRRDGQTVVDPLNPERTLGLGPAQLSAHGTSRNL